MSVPYDKAKGPWCVAGVSEGHAPCNKTETDNVHEERGTHYVNLEAKHIFEPVNEHVWRIYQDLNTSVLGTHFAELMDYVSEAEYQEVFANSWEDFRRDFAVYLDTVRPRLNESPRTFAVRTGLVDI